ncbi:TolC family outer membrane protein [Pseudomonas sp. NPDC007930]|uniref:TolC family outer membrane protein n=1 Tax=Pseudomonas sp. NPDC007930 TaxID=3364417 RepID=UPI0036F179DC
MRIALMFTLLLVGRGAYAVDVLDAYALALRHDPAFQAALQQHEAGLQERRIGLANLLPNLSYAYQTARNRADVTAPTSTGGGSVHRNYTSSVGALTLQQPLFDYAAWAQYRQGVARAALAGEQFRGRGQALVVRVFAAYSQALLAGEQIDLARAQRRAYAEQLQMNRHTFEAGEGTRTDILETQARFELAQAQELEAGDALDGALRELQAMTGAPVSLEQLAPLAEPFTVPSLQPARFEAWRDLAMQANAELAGQRHGLEVAEQEVERQRAGHLPTLKLYASARRTRSETENTYGQEYDTGSLGLQVSVPLFAGGGVLAAQRKASASYAQANYEYDAQRNTLLNDLRKQFNLCTSAVAKVRAYGFAAEAAQALVEATRQSVAGGERVNLDVLDAQQQRYSARRDLAEARYGYLNAWLQLKYLAGHLDEADLVAVARFFQRGQ